MNDKPLNCSHGPAQNQTTSWLICSWSIFSAWTSHMHTPTHKIHHHVNLVETTTSPLIVLSMPSHMGCTQMSFFSRTLETPKSKVPNFPKLGLPWFWKPIMFCVNLWLRWGLMKSYNICWEFSNDMWHSTYTQVNKGDFWLLMLGFKLTLLIPDPFFGHNLCFNYSNGTCNPILNI